MNKSELFFTDVAAAEGWSLDTQVKLLLGYITSQTGPDHYEAFVDFITQKVFVDFTTQKVEDTRDKCEACDDQGWLVSQRDDGYAAVECCDACKVCNTDEEAALRAIAAGVLCDLGYPCYVLALPSGWTEGWPSKRHDDPKEQEDPRLAADRAELARLRAEHPDDDRLWCVDL